MEQVEVIKNDEHLPNPTKGALPEVGKGRIDLSSKEALSLGIGLSQTYGPTGAFRMLGKKGNFNMLSNTAKSLVVFGIMIGVGILILTKFQDSTNSTSTAYTQIGKVIDLFSDLTTWGAIVLIVIMGYVILRYL